MKKFILSVLSVAAASLTMFACNPAADSSSQGSSETPASSADSSNAASSSVASSTGTSASGFDATKKITPYTRDTTSGTRDGFMTKIGVEKAKSNDKLLVSNVAQATSNGDMMTKIAADEYGIGYASFSEIDTQPKIKGIKVNGVAASEETVKDGTYALQRSFNYVIPSAAKTNNAIKYALIESYVAFMNTTDGQDIVVDKGGIIADANVAQQSWDDVIKTADWAKTLGLDTGNVKAEVKDVAVNFVGSTSVEDMSKALSDAWTAKFGANAPVANHNHTGSGDAVKKLADGSGDIGFASRTFTDAEKSAHTDWTFGTICLDAISVIVSKENPLENITAQQLRDIYINQESLTDSKTVFGTDYSAEKTLTTWSELIK